MGPWATSCPAKNSILVSWCAYTDRICAFTDGGCDEVYIQQIGSEQDRCFDFWESEIVLELAA